MILKTDRGIQIPKFRSNHPGLNEAFNSIYEVLGILAGGINLSVGKGMEGGWDGDSLILESTGFLGEPENSCEPWTPRFKNTGTNEAPVWVVEFDIGTINGAVATNWDAEISIPAYETLYFVVVTLSMTGGTGAISSFALSLSSSPPAASDLDPSNMGVAPSSLSIVLGAIKEGSSYMAYCENLTINAIEKLRTSKAGVPSAGLEPFDRWWGWQVRTVSEIDPFF